MARTIEENEFFLGSVDGLDVFLNERGPAGCVVTAFEEENWYLELGTEAGHIHVHQLGTKIWTDWDRPRMKL